MQTSKHELMADPFAERSAARMHRVIHLLGAQIRFESDSEDLLQLVDSAYGGLPRHKLSPVAPRLRVRLVLTASERKPSRGGPAALQLSSAAGILVGAAESSDFVVISQHERCALVVVSPRILKFPYHTRYEFIEFAVFTLAARVQGLVALHAACVGHRGVGVLLLGPSGAGKSTLTLQCLMQGMGILSEDSVFVTPGTLLATGVSNYLHVRADSLAWIGQARVVAEIRKSPIIRRRSGVRKYEIDLRQGKYVLADSALKISAIVFLSAQPAAGRPLVEQLQPAQALRLLVREQPYAANQPPWVSFRRTVKAVPFFELRRGQHPRESVAALRNIMDRPSSAIR